MNWQEIREAYPNRWIIMEAIQAHTEGKKRVFDGMNVLGTCAGNKGIFPRYHEFRSIYPHKEIIFFMRVGRS